MKKLFFTLLATLLPLNTFATKSVTISAVVGNSNNSPIVQFVNPDGDPQPVISGIPQSFKVYFKDNEKDTVSYTINALDGGAISPNISGTIQTSDYDTNSVAYINFTYLTVSLNNTPTTVTITLNDGPNVVVKTINLHVF